MVKQKDIEVLTNALPVMYNDLYDPAMQCLLRRDDSSTSWPDKATNDDCVNGDAASTDVVNETAKKVELHMKNNLCYPHSYDWTSEEEIEGDKNHITASIRSKKDYLFGNLTDFLRTKQTSSSSPAQDSNILILWHPQKVKVTIPLGKKKLNSQEEIDVSVPFFMARIIPILFDRFVVNKDEWFEEDYDSDHKFNDCSATVSMVEAIVLNNLDKLMNSHDSNFPQDITTEGKASIVNYFRTEDKNSKRKRSANDRLKIVCVHPMAKVFEGLSNELLAYIFHEHIYQDGGCVLCPNGYNEIVKGKNRNGDEVLNLNVTDWCCG